MKSLLCNVADIPADGTLKVDFFGRSAHAYLVDGRPQVALDICLHLGGPLRREGDRFVCEWHGAAFACGDGRCLDGPASPDSKLMLIPTRCENGKLMYVYGE